MESECGFLTLQRLVYGGARIPISSGEAGCPDGQDRKGVMARCSVLSASRVFVAAELHRPCHQSCNMGGRIWNARQDSPRAFTLRPATARRGPTARIFMPMVTYISSSGTARRVEAPFGMTLLQAALHHRVEGILGECGGNGMCATCHVYVDSAYLSRIPPAKENEKFMLSIAAEGPAANSRLCCQIKMTEELDEIMVRVPVKQK